MPRAWRPPEGWGAAGQQGRCLQCLHVQVVVRRCQCMLLPACIARSAIGCIPTACWQLGHCHQAWRPLRGASPRPSTARWPSSGVFVAVQVQETEIALAEAAFQKEKVRLEALWQQRKDEYSAAVATQVGLLIHCLLMACSDG